MKFRTKILGALAALFMVAGPAHAQVATGNDGALLIAIWDGVKSVVIDLNRTTNTATNSTGATLTSITTAGNTFTFDLSSILTAAGINLASANYMLFAADTVGGIGSSNRGLVSTVNSATASPTLASANVKGAADYVGGFVTAEMNVTCAGTVSCAAAANTDTQYWGASDVSFNVAAWAADAAVGTQLQLFSFLNGTGTTTTAANTGYTALLGSTGQLSIASPLQPLPVLLSSNATIPGLEPALGQRKVRLVPLANGRVVAAYARGLPVGCATFGPCTEQSTVWHMVLDQQGVAVAPQRTWAALDVITGLSADSVYPGTGGMFGEGTSAVFAMAHSGNNTGGGNFVRIDSAGTVLSQLGGTGAYDGKACLLGQDLAVLTRTTNPSTSTVQWWTGASTLAGSTALQGMGHSLHALACGNSAALGSNFAAVVRAIPSTAVSVGMYTATGASWTAVGLERSLATSAANVSPQWGGGVATGDDRGVVLYRDTASDGRTNMFYARFRVTAAGITLVDSVAKPVFSSATYQGVDGAVTYGGNGVFYLAVYHGGAPAAGQLPNTLQAVRLFSLAFDTDTLQQTNAAYEDSNFTQATQTEGYSVVKSCDGNVYVGGSVDGGGGRGVLKIFKVNVQPAACSSPPVVTKTVTGTLGANGWYIGDVSVSWVVDARGSTITSKTGCTNATVAADTAGTIFSCSVTTAGGTVTDSVTVKRDTTAPVASATPSPLRNAAGWNNTPVSVAFSGTDATSGIASCSTGTSLTLEGANQNSSTGTCTDLAGNISTPIAVTGVNIDLTKPVVSATPSRQPNGAGWHNGAVTVAYTAVDSLSGIALDGCDAPTLLANDGAAQSASGACRDRAGNTASASLSGINIDQTKPVATAVPSIPANAANWFNAAVTVAFNGTDALTGSGIASCTAPVAVTTDVTGLSVAGSCTDVAGNISSTAALVVNLDRVAPTVTIASPAQGATYSQGAVLLSDFTCADDRSGVFSCVGSVPKGQAVSTATTGVQGFAAAVTDAAGNSAIRTNTYTLSVPVPAFTLTPATLAFGSQALNVASAALPVTLVSNGGAALPITSVALAGTNANQFTLGNSCGSSVASGTSCVISIAFRPTTAGAKTASLSVVSTGGGTKTVALTGTGATTAFTLAPTSLAFGNQPISAVSAARAVTVTNSGTVALPMSTLSFTGTGANQFRQTNNCGTQVAVAATCTISVAFAPTTTGAKTASLSVSVLGGAAARTVALTGTGTAAVLVLNPGSVAFTAQTVGTVSTAKAVTLSNSGGTAMLLSRIALAGTAATEYRQTNNCGTQLVARGSCTISLSFAPATKGAKSASVMVTTVSGTSSTLAVSGTAN